MLAAILAAVSLVGAGGVGAEEPAAEHRERVVLGEVEEIPKLGPTPKELRAEKRKRAARAQRERPYLWKTTLRSDGRTARPPTRAPLAVKRVVWASNRITRKPYRYGGGHAGPLEAEAYDCSSAVSYGLRVAKLLDATRVSGGFMDYGRPGSGRWITIRASDGHVYMVVGGLRFDTSAYGRGGKGPRWRPDPRPTQGVARSPSSL